MSRTSARRTEERRERTLASVRIVRVGMVTTVVITLRVESVTAGQGEEVRCGNDFYDAYLEEQRYLLERLQSEIGAKLGRLLNAMQGCKS